MKLSWVRPKFPNFDMHDIGTCATTKYDGKKKNNIILHILIGTLLTQWIFSFIEMTKTFDLKMILTKTLF